MKILVLILASSLGLQAQPKPQRFTLPNGLRVVHLEDHQRPLVRACLRLELAPTDTPPERQGLAPFALRMFDRSEAGDMGADELDGLLEGAGIQVTRALDTRFLEWRLLARSRDQDRAMGLLADRLLRTILSPQLLEAQRLACWREQEQKQAFPRRILRESLSPHPELQPTILGLGAITFEDLLAFRARVFRPDRAILVLHGDLGLEQAKRLVLLNLGSWVAQPVAPIVAVGKPSASSGDPVRIPAQRSEVWAQMVAALPSDLSTESEALLRILLPGHPALSPAEVSVEDHCLVATLEGATNSSAEDVLTDLRKRLDGFRQRGFTHTELDAARKAWLARTALASLHPEALIEAALEEAMGRSLSLEQMKILSLDALNADLRRCLDLTGARSGVVGPVGPAARP